MIKKKIKFDVDKTEVILIMLTPVFHRLEIHVPVGWALNTSN